MTVAVTAAPPGEREMSDELSGTAFASTAAEELARNTGLTDADFDGLEPSGATGFTKADVESVIQTGPQGSDDDTVEDAVADPGEPAEPAEPEPEEEPDEPEEEEEPEPEPADPEPEAAPEPEEPVLERLGLGDTIRFHHAGQKHEGVVIGADPDPRLEVRLKDGADTVVSVRGSDVYEIVDDA